MLDDTRFRSGCSPSKLDYIFTTEENIIDDLTYGTPLGKSDHVVLTWLTTVVKQAQIDENENKFNCWKGDYASISSVMSKIDWQKEFDNKSVEDM